MCCTYSPWLHIVKHGLHVWIWTLGTSATLSWEIFVNAVRLLSFGSIICDIINYFAFKKIAR